MSIWIMLADGNYLRKISPEFFQLQIAHLSADRQRAVLAYIPDRKCSNSSQDKL